MKTIKALEILKREMVVNGLAGKWTGRINNRLEKTFGQCNSRKHKIELSRKLIKINEEKVVRLVILHEIAHALTPFSGHNRNWKNVCLKLGGDGKTRYSSKTTNTLGNIHLPTGNDTVTTTTKIYKFINKQGIEIVITETHR